MYDDKGNPITATSGATAGLADPDEPEIISLESLFEQVADEEREAQVVKDLLLGQGSWTTVPALTLVIEKRTKDPNKGRIVARFFAQVQRLEKGTVEKGAIGFRLSNDFRKNEKGNWDMGTRLYLAAKQTAVKAGVAVGSPGAVYQFLRDYPVSVRVRHLDGNEQYPEPSAMVMNISPVRPA
jgi:hypothetical protein